MLNVLNVLQTILKNAHTVLWSHKQNTGITIPHTFIAVMIKTLLLDLKWNLSVFLNYIFLLHKDISCAYWPFLEFLLGINFYLALLTILNFGYLYIIKSEVLYV